MLTWRSPASSNTFAKFPHCSGQVTPEWGSWGGQGNATVSSPGWAGTLGKKRWENRYLMPGDAFGRHGNESTAGWHARAPPRRPRVKVRRFHSNARRHIFRTISCCPDTPGAKNASASATATATHVIKRSGLHQHLRLKNRARTPWMHPKRHPVQHRVISVGLAAPEPWRHTRELSPTGGKIRPINLPLYALDLVRRR